MAGFSVSANPAPRIVSALCPKSWWRRVSLNGSDADTESRSPHTFLTTFRAEPKARWQWSAPRTIGRYIHVGGVCRDKAHPIDRSRRVVGSLSLPLGIEAQPER